MSAFGGKADVNYCAGELPLLAKSGVEKAPRDFSPNMAELGVRDRLSTEHQVSNTWKAPGTRDFRETTSWLWKTPRVGGGPGRTRTCNQTVMSGRL